MKVHWSGLLVLTLVGLAAYATDQVTETSVVPPVYSNNERQGMLVCLGLADMAGSIAQQKLDNVPLEKVKSHYASQPDEKVAQMGVATADKVYAETVTDWWTYESAFFDECAQNLAGVPAGRVELANGCLQEAMVADEAYGFKSRHTPRAEALAYLARFGIKGPRAEGILDEVYATGKERAELKPELWNRCMSKLSAGDDHSGWTAPPAPSRRATVPASVPAQPDRTVIYILRESTGRGLASPFQLSLDGENLGDIKPGWYYAVTVAPGAHVAVVSAHEDRGSLMLTAEAGSTHFVKVERLGTISVRVALKEIDAIEGGSLVSSMSLAGEFTR